MDAGLRGPLLAVAATVAVLTLALLALPEGSLWAAGIDDASTTSAAALAAMLAFRRAGRDSSAWGWRLLGLGLAFSAAGEAYWFLNDIVLRTEVGTASLADSFYFVGYTFFLAALASWFPRTSETGAWLRRLLDFAIIGASLSLVAWVVALEGLVIAGAGDPLGTFVAASYPLLDIAIGSAFLVLAWEVVRGARLSLFLIGFGIAGWALADLAYAYLSVHGGYASGFPLAGAWVGGYLLMALGAAHAPQGKPAPERDKRAWLAWLPYYVAAPALAMALLRFATFGDFDQTEEALLLVVMLALLLRQFILMRATVLVADDLQASQARLSGILDLQEALVLRVSLDGRITYMNGAYERTFGLQIGDTFWSKIHPDDHAQMKATMGLLEKPPHTASVEQRVETKHGWRQVFWQGSVVRDSSGAIVEFQAVGFDVTERRQAEKDLAAREALLEETQAVGHIGSWEIDLVNGSYSCSPENSRLFAIEHKAVHDPKEAMRNLHPDDLPAVQGAIDATVRNGSTEILQRIVLPDGKLRYLRSRGELRRDAQGKPARIVGLSIDVTDQHAADEALHASNERFRLAAQATRDVIWDWDLTTNSFLHSDNMLSIFGHNPAKFSKSMDAFVAQVHPDDVAALAPMFESLGPGGPSTFAGNYRFKHADGSYRIVLDRAHILRGPEGRATRVVGAMQDVTEERKAADALRASEERIRSLLDNLEEVYVSTDLVGGTSTNSAAIEKVFGQARAVYNADPMAWSKQIHPEDAPRVMGRYADLMAGTPTVDETRIIRADGAVRWIRASMKPVKDASGKVVRLDGVLRDITAEREARQQEAEVKRLQEVTAFKTQFLNNAAHELATPLTPIKLQMASLKRSIFGELTPKQAEAVGLLDRNLERLSLLVGDLLDAARLQSGRLKVVTKDVSLGPLAADVVASFAEKARVDGITLSSNGFSQSVLVAGDEARLNQVLFNLVHNAMKFTSRGGHIEVSLTLDGAQAVLGVTDSGIGLAPEQIARLFHPFTQVHDTVAHSVGGTGLGLYISHGIVEQHNGVLSCRSPGKGRGSTFEVRLPLKQPAPAPLQAVPG
ncbi:MAG: PAS domain-containing protein [Candidatus Thermoplasmatota archaeon]|jgi:PAS domain S-box-containing protein